MRTPWRWAKEHEEAQKARWAAEASERAELRRRGEAPGGGAPTLGTPEARERLRQSGVPLDEWVDMSSPAWRAEQERKSRRADRDAKAFWAVVALAVGGYIAWGIHDGVTAPSPAERLPACGPGVTPSCTFTTADGALMVETFDLNRRPIIETAADFDESYYSWQEEYANDCIPGTPGGGC